MENTGASSIEVRGIYKHYTQKTGLRKAATSAGADSLFPLVGGMAASVGWCLGKRVPRGGQHIAGVNAREMMSPSRALGVRKVDFRSEVCTLSQTGCESGNHEKLM